MKQILQSAPVVNLPAGSSEEKNGSVGSHAGAAFFVQKLTDLGLAQQRLKVLVAGCGSGHEAKWVHDQLDCQVDAVDVDDFVPADMPRGDSLRFQIASVCELPFPDQSFDVAFYYHVIEHVDQPADSLAELHRVLKPGGWLFVGTPNRHRLISSIGAHQQSEWESTFFNKFKDNVRDWSDRFRGRFENRFGAHAGFSRRELDGMLADHFDLRQWSTNEYLKFKYKRHWARAAVNLVTLPPVAWFLAPAIYAFCQKSEDQWLQ